MPATKYFLKRLAANQYRIVPASTIQLAYLPSINLYTHNSIPVKKSGSFRLS